ncbi:hypothetical protein HaLaN_11959, partial [Haematococcus lacustris]
LSVPDLGFQIKALVGKMAAKWMACVVLAVCVAAAAAQIRTDRLREHRITLEARKPQNLLGIPVVDPPTRVSGYFKLARTYAAEMFYVRPLPGCCCQCHC